jgi:hypothetical protein
MKQQQKNVVATGPWISFIAAVATNAEIKRDACNRRRT